MGIFPVAGAERVLPSLSRASGKSKKLQPLRYTAARLLEKGVLLEIEDLPVSQCVPLPPGRAVAAQSSGTGREVAALAVFLGLQWMRDPPLCLPPFPPGSRTSSSTSCPARRPGGSR